jgi:hypothetical protein
MRIIEGSDQTNYITCHLAVLRASRYCALQKVHPINLKCFAEAGFSPSGYATNQPSDGVISHNGTSWDLYEILIDFPV